MAVAHFHHKDQAQAKSHFCYLLRTQHIYFLEIQAYSIYFEYIRNV